MTHLGYAEVPKVFQQVLADWLEMFSPKTNVAPLQEMVRRVGGATCTPSEEARTAHVLELYDLADSAFPRNLSVNVGKKNEEGKKTRKNKKREKDSRRRGLPPSP